MKINREELLKPVDDPQFVNPQFVSQSKYTS